MERIHNNAHVMWNIIMRYKKGMTNNVMLPMVYSVKPHPKQEYSPIILHYSSFIGYTNNNYGRKSINCPCAKE